MRNKVLGEQLAQVDNPDPFAPPVWRSPVYRTPEAVIWVVQLVRLLVRVVWFVVRHPYLDLAAGVVAMVWLNGSWPAACGLAVSIVITLAVWRWRFYRRRWQPVLTIARLVPTYRGRVLVPVLGPVEASRFADRVTVTLVSGQSPEDFADRADNLAHGFRVHLCRVRTATPGTIVLELVRRDALAQPIPALPIGQCPDLRALPVGRCEDGSPWLLKLHGTHLLVAGATGAGKGSILWSAVRAMLPLMALHFAALFDRFVQNLRRFVGYDVQYFAAIEPQRRLAPHVHIAMRGTVSRAELRQVLAATYHQVWWPPTDTIRFDDTHLPEWDEHTSNYLDPVTGEVLPTWDEALDAIGDQDEPCHVARFGTRFDAQGVLAGSKDSARCIGYLTKYLTKHVADCHQTQTDAQRAHAERLADALRYEPCSPTCANWLRYGVQPKNARPGLKLGYCKGKAHRREHLGFAGRRVLVSRRWSGKTLADHRADRKAWLMGTFGISATDPARYSWEPVTPGDPDHMPNAQRLLHVVADRQKWYAALIEARRRASDHTYLSGTVNAA